MGRNEAVIHVLLEYLRLASCVCVGCNVSSILGHGSTSGLNVTSYVQVLFMILYNTQDTRCSKTPLTALQASNSTPCLAFSQRLCHTAHNIIWMGGSFDTVYTVPLWQQAMFSSM